MELLQGSARNSPDLDLIKKFWSQIKHMQKKERATSAKDPEKGLERSGEISPRILQELLPEKLQQSLKSGEAILSIDNAFYSFNTMN